ncbi:MAG: hypothetical protein EXR58_03420 [Chloroflexi bacterium]|nr:hypothetical protein [Chloroflexota bacterium]
MTAEPSVGLAITVSRGSSNNLFQVATLVRAATALEMSVRVLFQGPSAAKLMRNRINLSEWSAIYQKIEPQLNERLSAAEFSDLESFLRDAKEHGEDVAFWVSEQTVLSRNLHLEDLASFVDGAISDQAFEDLAGGAAAVLRF